MTNAEQDIKIAQTKQEVDDFKAIIENFIGEMRDRDNKRDADIKEMREKHDADMKEMREKQDAIANELRGEIRDGIRHIQGLTIASMVGIIAIAVAVLAFVWQNHSNDSQTAYQHTPPAQTQNYSPPQNATQ